MLSLDGVGKRYGTVTALDGCSFAAAPGRLTGFVGPNGAGKTTAMRAVLGLVAPEEGVIHWRGRPITAADRQRFGYMPEERGLYPRMRVREQLAYLGRLSGLGPAEAGRAADRSLAALGLAERAGDRVDALSHGNQQRVQLAAALVHEPELLLLDEPFSGLDPIAMDAMADILAGFAGRGATVLFSSHQLDLVEHLCEDVVVIDRGRVILSGELTELRAGAAQRFVDVTLRGGEPGWADGEPGVRVLERSNGRLRLEVDPTVDLPRLVALASAAGELVELSYQPPTLSELFRRTVGS